MPAAGLRPVPGAPAGQVAPRDSLLQALALSRAAVCYYGRSPSAGVAGKRPRRDVRREPCGPAYLCWAGSSARFSSSGFGPVSGRRLLQQAPAIGRVGRQSPAQGGTPGAGRPRMPLPDKLLRAIPLSKLWPLLGHPPLLRPPDLVRFRMPLLGKWLCAILLFRLWPRLGQPAAAAAAGPRWGMARLHGVTRRGWRATRATGLVAAPDGIGAQ